MDGKLFVKNLQFWHAEVRKRTSDNVCLILDNCSAHGTRIPKFSGVEYILLPANITEIYQTIDEGAPRTLKVETRRYLLQTIIDNMEQYDELTVLGSK